jgi:hypothetical protein
MIYTREDSRRYEKTPEQSGRRGAAKWPAPPIGRLAPLGHSSMNLWTILPPPPRMHLNRTSSQFDPLANVGPPGLYKETPAP